MAGRLAAEEKHSWWESVLVNLLAPDQWWERAALAVLGAAAICLLGYIAYRFYREVVWELAKGRLLGLARWAFTPQALPGEPAPPP